MKYITISLVFLLVFLYSCTEEFNLEFDNPEPKLVIEGNVTDQPGPYFVRLNLSKKSFTNSIISDTIDGRLIIDAFTPVTDALVIISDSYGNVDTLIQSLDPVLMLNQKGKYFGYYETKKIKGTPGTTYFLNVLWKGKKFSSTCTMPAAPAIDSVTYAYTVGATGKSDYFIPNIWFKDNASTRDFYLFKTEGAGGVWSRAILSDKNMKPDVIGLDVFKGESPDWWMTGYPMPGTKYKITMSAISEDIFNYYSALIAQFRNDGGVYTPSPASPPTNINNGAIGYFNASSVRIVEDIMPKPPLK